MDIRPFKAEDWYLDEPLEVIETQVDVDKLDQLSIAFSIFDGDTCVCCMGIVFWGNEVEAWISVSKRAIEHPVTLLKAIREVSNLLRSFYDGRVFCWVDVEWPEAQRMAAWIGFKKTDKTTEHDNKTYCLWEVKDGDSIISSGAGSTSGRASTTG